MVIKTENPTRLRLIVSIIGGIGFFLLNTFFPWMHLLFPYLEGPNLDFWANEAEANGVVTDFDYFREWSKLGENDWSLFWQLLELWQWVLLFGGLAALILVIVPQVRAMRGKEVAAPLALIGFLVGLVASGIEWFLYIMVWSLEDWATQPDLGILLLILNIIGFILLFLAAIPEILVRG
ncbi:MAG: hypothetical protein ACFFCQ_09035 [Promethearchaeota archaeon]